MIIVTSLVQLKILEIYGFISRLKKLRKLPAIRYIKSGFIPNTAKNIGTFLKFKTSISQYEIAIPIKHQPPLTIINELVQICLMIGMKGFIA